jgi:hypothetical protein
MTSREIAKALGASRTVTLRRAPQNPLDAMALAGALREQLKPGSGRRPGRPTNPKWEMRRQVPFSRETWARLEECAAAASTPERRVSPAQVAAEILDRVLSSD